MPKPKMKLSRIGLQHCWRGSVHDYVRAMVWSPTGQTLAIASAAGEVVLWTGTDQSLFYLQTAGQLAIDALGFSADGQFLAAGGQDGQVRIWEMTPLTSKPLLAFNYAPAWVERLAWHPHRPLLAFSLGKYVQVWDLEQQVLVTTLNFASSSVLGLSWQWGGNGLGVAGYGGIKLWDSRDWDEDPYHLEIGSATIAIAWSPDDCYLAAGNMDRTITVIEWDADAVQSQRLIPWVMRGFPGKVRHLAWSEGRHGRDFLLAAASSEGIVVWERHPDPTIGWSGRVLQHHQDVVQGIGFQPQTPLLASVAADGLGLWQRANQLACSRSEDGARLSALAWQPQGQWLATGGEGGELSIYGLTTTGQGFGS